VSVHDVEPLAAQSPAQLARRARVAPGGKGEDGDLDVPAPPQGGDLVAHEAAAPGSGRRRPHARDDEGTHLRVILHRAGLSP
jgi:hypothetical protein